MLRDTIEITRCLQLIGGARFDRFDMSALDMNTNIKRNRVDNQVSPQAAVIVKPIETISIYTAYSISYLPASGDQFSALNDGTLILQPQKFENNEVGVKWNINPRLLFTAAVYELNRTNVPIADPNNPGFFFPSGSHRDPRLRDRASTATSPTNGSPRSATPIPMRGSPAPRRRPSSPGNRVQLVPYNQFSLVEQVSVHADVGGLARHHLLLGFVCLVRRHRQIAGLRPLRRRRLRQDQRTPGRRSSTSRTSSTRAIGHRPTATTTSRRASRGPFRLTAFAKF